MAKFCKKCGASLTPSMKFCQKCGTPVMGTKPAAGAATVSPPAAGRSSAQRALPFIAGAAVLLLAGGGYWYIQQAQPEPSASTAVETVAETPPEANTQAGPEANAQVTPVTPMSQAQDELAARNIKSSVLATSYGHSSDGFLAIDGAARGSAKNPAGRILVLDRKNGRIAEAAPRMTLVEFARQRDAKNPAPLIVDFRIFSDQKDNDASQGSWNGNDHLMPIYMLYRFDEQGAVVPGMLYSGAGQNPSHFQDPLYEPRNVDLANLFLTEALPLLENAKANKLNLQ